ncbi:MAG: MoaD/ThiS family protein [Gemmataceae bacterium]
MTFPSAPSTRIVSIRLFARARDLVGAEVVAVRLPAGATVGDARRVLAEAHPELAALLERSALAVGDEYANDSLTLPIEAELAVIPPVSGG